MITKNRSVARLATDALFLCLLLLPSAGCVQLATMMAHATGGDWIEPEFNLTHGRLLVLVEDPSGLVSQPRALRELHREISEKFLEFSVNSKIVPPEDIERIKRKERDYGRLSIREVGEKHGAEQVLYIRVDQFTLQAEEGAPLYKGLFTVRVKVLSTEAERDVRLWPRDPSGRRVSVGTPPVATDSGKSESDVARELAVKMGAEVAKLFYGHRELEE